MAGCRVSARGRDSADWGKLARVAARGAQRRHRARHTRAPGSVAERADVEHSLYTRLCFDGDRLVGAITIGHPQHVGAIRGLIQSHRHLGAWKDELMKNPHLVMDAFVDLNNG